MRKITFISIMFLTITILLGRGEILVRSTDFSKFPHVSVSFSVKRPDNFYETDLNKSNITIREANGHYLDFSLKREKKDVYMIIAIDVSGSLKKSLPTAKLLIKQLMEKLTGFDLKVSICEFGYDKEGGIKIYGDYNIKKPETQKKILDLIENLKAYGSTPLYDAIYQSLSYLNSKKGSGIILVFSDGFDEDFEGKKNGSNISLNTLLKLSSKVIVHTIGISGDKGINEEVLRKISNNFHGKFFKFNEETDQSKNLDDIRKRILESIKNIYTVEFDAKFGEYAILQVNKLDYFAEAKIMYPEKLEDKEEIYLPAGYRGVVKFDIEGKKIKKELEKNMGCFVEGVYVTKDKIIAYCNDSIKVLNKNLEILKNFDTNGVAIGFSFDGKIIAGLIGKGLVSVDNNEDIFKCDLKSADIQENSLLLNCKDRVILMNLNNLKETAKFSWKGGIKSLGTSQRKLVISDYEKGVYLVEGTNTTLLKKESGINDFEDGYYINGLSSQLKYINGKTTKLSFYPVKLIKEQDYLFALGWLGEIAVYDKDLNLKEFIPAISTPRLVRHLQKVKLLIGGVLYSVNDNRLEKENFELNGKIYDVWEDEKEILYALGDKGLLIKSKNEQKMFKFPSYRVAKVRNLYIVYGKEKIALLDKNGKTIKVFDVHYPVNRISVSHYGACIPRKDDVIVINNNGNVKLLNVSFVKDCVVGNSGIYIINGDLGFISLDGAEISRIPIPDFSIKIILHKEHSFILTSTGKLLRINGNSFEIVKRNCIDILQMNDQLFILTKNPKKGMSISALTF